MEAEQEKKATPQGESGAGPKGRPAIWNAGFVLISLAFFYAAVRLRQGVSPYFVNPDASASLAQALFRDFPPTGESLLFKSLLKSLFLDFAKTYVLSLIFFVFSLYFAARGLSGPADGFFARLRDGARRLCTEKAAAAGAVFIIIFAGAVLAAKKFLGPGGLYCTGEYPGLFQAMIFQKGKLFLQSIEAGAAFHAPGIVNDGRWYAGGPAGWPLILTAASLFRLQSLLGGILGGAAILSAYLAAREAYGWRAGLAAACFLALSPIFFASCLTLLPHVPHMLFFLLFLYMYLRGWRESPPSRSFPAGGALLGAAFLVKPALTLILLLPVLVHAILEFREQAREARRGLALRLGAMTAVFVVMATAGILLAWGRSGSLPAALAHIFSDGRTGPALPSLLSGTGQAWNLLLFLGRIPFWTCIMTCAAALCSLGEMKRESYLFVLLAFTSAVPAFTEAMQGSGGAGPDFFLPGITFMALAAGNGIFRISPGRLGEYPARTAIPLFFAGAGIFMALCAFPPILSRAAVLAGNDPCIRLARLIEKEKDGKNVDLVFIRTFPGPGSMRHLFCLPASGGVPLTALFLDESTNDRVRSKFQDGRRLILDYQKEKDQLILSPDSPAASATGETRARDGEASAFNYFYAAGDLQSALGQLDGVLALFPDRIDVILLKARMMMETGHYKEAAEMLESVRRRYPGTTEAYYALGVCYGRLGRKEEALTAFRVFGRLEPESPLRMKVQMWEEYLSRK